MSPYLFLRFLFLPVLALAGSLVGGWWNFSVPVICFGIHPLLNFFSKKTSSLYDEDVEVHHQYSAKAYRLVPLLFVP
ncbi:MAG: hypothetical protein ACHQF0_12980, partial [Chitinophagales bacterium]